jgi:hypothetical protein
MRQINLLQNTPSRPFSSSLPLAHRPNPHCPLTHSRSRASTHSSSISQADSNMHFSHFPPSFARLRGQVGCFQLCSGPNPSCKAYPHYPNGQSPCCSSVGATSSQSVWRAFRPSCLAERGTRYAGDGVGSRTGRLSRQTGELSEREALLHCPGLRSS